MAHAMVQLSVHFTNSVTMMVERMCQLWLMLEGFVAAWLTGCRTRFLQGRAGEHLQLWNQVRVAIHELIG